MTEKKSIEAPEKHEPHCCDCGVKLTPENQEERFVRTSRCYTIVDLICKECA